MGINEIIMYIMMFFMLIAAVDRILSQFGGSARFLGKFGKSIEGSWQWAHWAWRWSV